MKTLTNIILAFIITFLLIIFLNPAHAYESIYGTPRVIDGDTIEINSTKTRLKILI